MTTFQSMAPLVASPLYGFMYKSTIETFPGAFLIFTACMYLVVAAILAIIWYGLKQVKKRRLEDEANGLNQEEGLLSEKEKEALEVASS